jgi:hypothetical protein
MKIKKHNSYTIEHEGREYGVDIQPCDWSDPVIADAGNGVTVLGYLSHDDSPSDPLKDSGCMGSIEKFNEHDFGFNGYGEPELDDIIQGIIDEDDLEIPGDGTEDEGLAALARPIWIQEQSGEYPVALEYNSYSDEPYSIVAETAEDLLDMDGSEFRQISHQWSPDKYLRQELNAITDPTERRKKALEFCRQALSEYNKYCTGDVYGVVTVTFDKDGSVIGKDSCWGFYGIDYANESLAERVAEEVASIKQERGKNQLQLTV